MRGQAAFDRICHKRRPRIRSGFRRNLRDDLRSTSFEIEHISDTVFGVLQPETLEEEILRTSSSSSSDDSNDGVSDTETSDDDLDRIYEGGLDEDISMSDTSSDDDDTSTFADDELDLTDSDIDNNPPRVFDQLKQMYLHRYETPHKRLPKPQEPFIRHLLGRLKNDRPDHFSNELRISPLTFDRLVEVIKDDPVFVSHSDISPQAPVEEQLAVALYRFGHNGNGASLQAIANWAGIGKGTVELHTHRVMAAFLQPEFMRNSVRWPDEEEKEEAKKWIQAHSCKAWRNGCYFVDGTLVPLASRPYWYGESYFDRKCRYSLNVQVCI